MAFDPFDMNTDQEETDDNLDAINPDQYYRDTLAGITTEWSDNDHTSELFKSSAEHLASPKPGTNKN